MNKRPTPLPASIATVICAFIFVMGCMRIYQEIRAGYIPWLLAYLILALLIILPVLQWLFYFAARGAYLRQIESAANERQLPVDDTVWPPPPRT